MRVALMAAAAAVIGIGGMAMTSAPASASVVCNGNVCWHTHHGYHYPASVGVVVHGDNWHWGAHDHYAWHEHTGRGYWRDGLWVTF